MSYTLLLTCQQMRSRLRNRETWETKPNTYKSYIPRTLEQVTISHYQNFNSNEPEINCSLINFLKNEMEIVGIYALIKFEYTPFLHKYCQHKFYIQHPQINGAIRLQTSSKTQHIFKQMKKGNIYYKKLHYLKDI